MAWGGEVVIASVYGTSIITLDEEFDSSRQNRDDDHVILNEKCRGKAFYSSNPLDNRKKKANRKEYLISLSLHHPSPTILNQFIA